ncbi:S-layer homology domain-containing protein [Anoxybacillus kestanbolensis]|uniref:S-layer homology domain-containing protein n=1 Tax=Anoxybacillus kestanbolensis TaxID=227476 RepID=UPI003D1BA4DA
MAYQPKSYRKFLAGTVSAAVVASAIAPVASAASFTDVAGSVHADDIATLVAKGYIKGYSDGTFKPNKPLTRGEAAIIFSRILKDAGVKAPEQGAGFPDVPASKAELAEAVAIVKAAGVMGGDEKGNFNPNANITREQMAKVVVEAFKLTKPANHTTKITDLDKAGSWAREYIQTLEANGVTKNTEFAPKQNVTRGQFASFVVRAMDVKKEVSAADITAVKLVDEKTLEVTFNGELKEVKKEDFAIQGVEIESVSIKAAAAAEAKTTVVVIKTKTALQEGKSYSVSYKGQTTDKAKVNVPVVTPKVESVSAINAKQIEIKFNTKMDKDSVTDVTKYSIKRAGVTATQLSNVSSANEYASAELSEDGKTLTITFKNALTSSYWGSIAEGDTFNFQTAKLKAVNGKEIDAASYAVKYSDKVAPAFVSAKASAKTTTNKITLTFSEPIDYSVASVSVDGVFGSLSAGSKPNELVVTTNSNLEAGKTYNLQILNVKDVAGNLLTPNPVNTTVTVTSDAVAPVVTDVKVVRDNLIEVTFDKSMDASTLTANGTVKLMDANFSNTNAVSSVTAKDSTNKVFRIALNPVSFNDSGNFSGTLVISDSAKDSLGNAMVTTTKAVYLVKDAVKPQAISVKYVKATTYGDQTGLTNGALVVKFSEEIQTSTGSIVVVDDQGRTVTVGAPVVNGKDLTELIIPLTAPVAQTAKSYTVSVSASTVKDLSSQQNSNALATLTADVSAGAIVGKDTAAPSITSISGVAAVKATSTGNRITFTIQDQANAGETASGVDFTTVADVNNYRLDGAPLPAGSYVTVAGAGPSYTVTIQMPFGAISKDKDNYSLNINGIKDKAGNVITPVAVNTVSLKDDVKPELKTATLNAGGTVSLGFSEDVVPVAANSVLDFTVELNGSTLTKPTAAPATALAYELVDGTGADAGKYVLRVKVSKGTQTVASAATGITINGVKYTVSNDGDNLLFKFIDVNGSGAADNGDIILSATDVDSTTQAFAFDSYYDLTKATSLKVGTVANPAVVTDASTLANELVGGKKITVK